VKHGFNHALINNDECDVDNDADNELMIMMMKTLMTMIKNNVEMTCVGGWVRPTSTV
jgi:hypothetical protein